MTIIDVAKAAGVSKSTVSRVLNSHQSVDPALVRRVRAAMDSIGFVPKANRRGPKPKPMKVPGFQSGALGVLIIGRTREVLELPYMARQLAGFTECAQERGLNVMIIEMPHPSELPPIIRERGVDGVVAMGAIGEQKLVDMLNPLPSVWLGGDAPVFPLVDHVVPNNAAIGLLAAQYLVERNCRRFAFVNNEATHISFSARRVAYVDVLREHMQKVDIFEPLAQGAEHLLWDSERMRIDIGRLVRRIVKRKTVPDGFFLPSDQQASIFQALMVAEGLVPEQDFFTISCNCDEAWLATMTPRAATIDPCPLDVGRAAARQLIRRIENPFEEVVTITVRPHVILPDRPAVRGS